MAVIRPKDETRVTAPVAGDTIMLDGDTVRSILVTDLLATTQPLDPTLTALSALDTGAGIVVQTGADSFLKRILTGTAGEITITNGSGAAGNPTVSLPAALTFAGKTVAGGTFNSPAIITPTGIVKGDVGLGNVDNTSDATKNAAAVVLTNKTLNASNNTISNLTTAMFAANVIDNDTTMAANSSTRIPTQAAVKAALDGLIAAADAMVFKGVIDCSANPNYPAADRGWTYKVSVAGKIGGAAGTIVEIGDTLLCITDGTASGTQAAVGAQWNIVQANLVGAVTGPAASTSGNIATFNGTGGTVIQDSGKALPVGTIVGTSDAQALTGKTYNGLTITTTTGTFTLAAGKTLSASNTLTFTGTDGSSVAFGAGGTVAYVANKLSVFAATTSAELASVISDETGNGALVFANAPTLVNPIVGTQTLGDNSTKAASTAFVTAAVAASTAGVATLGGQAGALTFDGGGMSSSVMALLRYDAPQASITPTQQSQARANAGVPGRNRIINGQFAVNERGAAGGVTDNAYSADRWRMIGEFASANIFADNYNAAGGNVPAGTLQFSGTTDKGGFFQIIEGRDCKDLRGKTVTLSMLLSVNNTRIGNMKIGILEWTGTEDATSADPVSSWGADGVTPTLIANWAFKNVPANLGVTTSSAQYSATVALGSTFTNLAVMIWNDDKAYTASDNFNVTNVQLEEGGVATPYEFIPIGALKRQCLRYLPVAGGASGDLIGVGDVFGTTIARIAMRWVEPPRVPPTAVTVVNVGNFTVTSGSTVNNAATAISLASQGPTGGQLNCSTGVALTNAAAAYLSASNVNARLLFTGCEL